MIVLGSLVAAMGLATAWLMLIRPAGQGAATLASFNDLSLAAFERPSDPADAVFQAHPQPDPNRWHTIVIRSSGGPTGSARLLDQLHKQAGLGDLAYHFTIGNGQGAEDGQVEIGPRWVQQRPGYTAMARHRDPQARHVIDICLIGDWSHAAPTDKQSRDLIWLVHQLQRRLNIPADRVLLGDGGGSQPGRLFPVASFRRQLLRNAGS